MSSPAPAPGKGQAATDVAVIGGGIMGSAVALRLAQRGIGVTVI